MFYDDNDVKTRVRINMKTADANSYYLRHYQIALLLKATMKNATDFKQKAFAREQMTIAERKMTFWARHDNFNISQIFNTMIVLKNQDFSRVCVNL